MYPRNVTFFTLLGDWNYFKFLGIPYVHVPLENIENRITKIIILKFLFHFQFLHTVIRKKTNKDINNNASYTLKLFSKQ